MPLLHCKKCHHEWEGNKDSICDWCGGGSFILEEETPLERFCRVFFESQEDLKPEYKEVINKHFRELI